VTSRSLINPKLNLNQNLIKVRVPRYHRKMNSSDLEAAATGSIISVKEYETDNDALVFNDLSEYVGNSLYS